MIHTLDELPPQAMVMVDANIVIYALFPQSNLHPTCKRLLERGARGELKLYLPVSVVADIIHRAMVLEAISQGIASKAGEVVVYLKQHPQVVQHLTRYKAILRDLVAVGMNILPLTYRDLHISKEYRDIYGLLTNDSLLPAVMQRERISYLATNDQDFARIPQIAVYQPQ